MPPRAFHAVRPRRHPWLVASLGAHAVLAAYLVAAGPVRVAIKRDQGVRQQVATSLQHTGERQMQRELRAMEAIRDALAQSAGEGDGKGKVDGKPGDERGAGAAKAKPVDPATRARELARQIEAVQQKVRADDMARLLHIPPEQALKRVRAEDARRPPSAPPAPPAAPDHANHANPQAQVSRLLNQAKAALAQRRAQLLAQQQGVPVQALDPLHPPPQMARGQAGQGPGGGKMPGPGGAGQGTGQQTGQGGQGNRAGGAGGSVHSSAAIGSAIDALASGLAMGAPGAITNSSLDMASSAFSDQRSFGSYGSYVRPPPIDAARVRGGAGHTIGAGGPYANRVFLDTWYIIGPFNGAGHDSQNAIYPPERGIDLDAVYFGKNDLPVRWTFQQDGHYPSVPLPRAENAVYYAYTEVQVERDVDLWMWIGGDDDTKLWFNDRLVWLSGDGDDKPWYRQAYYALDDMTTLNLSEGQRRLHFHKGRNTVLMKLYNGVNLMFFSVVLSPSA